MRLFHASLATAILLSAAVSATLAAAGPAEARPAPLPTVLSSRVLGYSVQHRPIVAYELGDRSAHTTAVLLGQTHGDEKAGIPIARAVIHGYPITGVHLWVVPTMNPDGNARGTRQNAHGIDLNRNWPHAWAPLSGQFYSGPHALSEPETRAMYRFLTQVRPTYLVSLHQPLNGVDTTDGGARDPAFGHRLASNLGLPEKAFRCWSVCHGSMTGWLTATQRGAGLVVEYGYLGPSGSAIPAAARGILAAFGARHDSVAAHDPLLHIDSVQTGPAGAGVTGTVRIVGWALDLDARGQAGTVRVTEHGRTVWQGATDRLRPGVNFRFHIGGRHGYIAAYTAETGAHRYCVTVLNAGPGARDVTACPASVTVEPAPSPPAPTG